MSEEEEKIRSYGCFHAKTAELVLEKAFHGISSKEMIFAPFDKNLFIASFDKNDVQHFGNDQIALLGLQKALIDTDTEGTSGF